MKLVNACSTSQTLFFGRITENISTVYSDEIPTLLAIGPKLMKFLLSMKN